MGPGVMAALEAASPRCSTETPASALVRQCWQYWASEMSSILLFSFFLLDLQCLFIISHIPPFPGGCSFPSEKATYKQTNVPPFLVEMCSTTLPLTSGFCKVTRLEMPTRESHKLLVLQVGTQELQLDTTWDDVVVVGF